MHPNSPLTSEVLSSFSEQLKLLVKLKVEAVTIMIIPFMETKEWGWGKKEWYKNCDRGRDGESRMERSPFGLRWCRSLLRTDTWLSCVVCADLFLPDNTQHLDFAFSIINYGLFLKNLRISVACFWIQSWSILIRIGFFGIMTRLWHLSVLSSSEEWSHALGLPRQCPVKSSRTSASFPPTGFILGCRSQHQMDSSPC